VLECSRFALTGDVNALSSGQHYDIRDADSGAVIGFARENIGRFTKVLRKLFGKRRLPTTIEVYEKPDDSLVFTISSGWSLSTSNIEVRDSLGQLVGYFRSKHRGEFQVYDKGGNYFTQVKGTAFGFNYRFLAADESVELGRVTHALVGATGHTFEWSETPGNYFLEIDAALADQPFAMMLLLAATLAADMIHGFRIGSLSGSQ
jgi:hypothetical protein